MTFIGYKGIVHKSCHGLVEGPFITLLWDMVQQTIGLSLEQPPF